MSDELSHVRGDEAVMVDVGGKEITARVAVASGRVVLGDAARAAVADGAGPKGPIVETARLAGIMGAKRTADLVPMCHPLPLDHVDVAITPDDAGVRIVATVRVRARTGVEMEALAAVTAAALTVVDMTKALGHGASITDVRVDRKEGGRSGTWIRPEVSA